MNARNKAGNATIIASVMITGTILLAVGIYYTAMHGQQSPQPSEAFVKPQPKATISPASVAQLDTDSDTAFRWIPKSENGVARVILPAVHAGDVINCELMIHGLGTMESLEKGADDGSYTLTYTFSKAGVHYPNPTYVVATLRDRTQVSWKVRKTNLRLRIDSEGDPLEAASNQAAQATKDKYAQTF